MGIAVPWVKRPLVTLGKYYMTPHSTPTPPKYSEEATNIAETPALPLK